VGSEKKPGASLKLLGSGLLLITVTLPLGGERSTGGRDSSLGKKHSLKGSGQGGLWRSRITGVRKKKESGKEETVKFVKALLGSPANFRWGRALTAFKDFLGGWRLRKPNSSKWVVSQKGGGGTKGKVDDQWQQWCTGGEWSTPHYEAAVYWGNPGAELVAEAKPVPRCRNRCLRGKTAEKLVRSGQKTLFAELGLS